MFRAPIQTAIILGCFAAPGLFALASCAGSDGSADAGAGDASEINSGPGDPIRVVLEGSGGYCSLREESGRGWRGELERTCSVVEDCVGFRIPSPVACCTTGIAGPDCDFARRGALPDEPLCTADAACKLMPRACVDNRCVIDLPPDECVADSDCVLLDVGCACISGNVNVTDYSPVFGTTCPPSACAPSARPRCIQGQCLVAGEFMDAALLAWCTETPGISCLALDPIDVAECVATYQANDYELAAMGWPLIAARELATSCSGWMSGSAAGLFVCMRILCP